MNTVKPHTADADLEWIYDRSCTCKCGVSYMGIDPDVDLAPSGPWAINLAKDTITMTCPTCSTVVVLTKVFPSA